MFSKIIDEKKNTLKIYQMMLACGFINQIERLQIKK